MWGYHCHAQDGIGHSFRRTEKVKRSGTWRLLSCHFQSGFYQSRTLLCVFAVRHSPGHLEKSLSARYKWRFHFGLSSHQSTETLFYATRRSHIQRSRTTSFSPFFFFLSRVTRIRLPTNIERRTWRPHCSRLSPAPTAFAASVAVHANPLEADTPAASTTHRGSSATCMYPTTPSPSPLRRRLFRLHHQPAIHP
jgi:hypothetical protein